MAAQDLTTRSAVRLFLQKETAKTGQDTLIDALITRASDAIMEYSERQFAPAETAATKVFAHYGGHSLTLAPYDLRTVTSITETVGTTSTVLASTDYVLRPKPARDGVYSWVKLLGTYRPSHEREFTIVGNWGYASIPEDVAHWCIVTVATWLRRDAAAFETTYSLAEERLERPEALPAAVRAGLAHYRRITI